MEPGLPPEDMMTALRYDSYTEARKHLKELLDAAEQGRPASVRRDSSTAMVVDADRFQRFLLNAYPSRAQVVAEEGGWSAFIPGLPVAADGATFDEAVTELIDALREYADDWQDHLSNVPNHADNWGLVHLLALSDDGQLREWLTGKP
jgi:predicted RNase H-like HicB family nuclease